MVKRGSCEFGQKVALAGAAGAAGAILYNNVDAGWGSVTLSTPSRPQIGPYVPVGGISLAEGEALVASLTAGTQITGSLRTSLYSEDRYSNNLIATTKVGNQKDLVVLGAHSDSVPAGPVCRLQVPSRFLFMLISSTRVSTTTARDPSQSSSSPSTFQNSHSKTPFVSPGGQPRRKVSSDQNTMSPILPQRRAPRLPSISTLI